MADRSPGSWSSLVAAKRMCTRVAWLVCIYILEWQSRGNSRPESCVIHDAPPLVFDLQGATSEPSTTGELSFLYSHSSGDEVKYGKPLFCTVTKYFAFIVYEI
jgi:hypothetical protein